VYFWGLQKGLQVLHAFVSLCGPGIRELVDRDEVQARQRLAHTTAQSMMGGTQVGRSGD
jgi:hypothetical protein